MTDIRYVSSVGTHLVKKAGDDANDTGARQLLLGARLHVDPALNVGGWVPATTARNSSGKNYTGFVELNRTSPNQQLKVFYTDVGQGDATLIEAEGSIVVIDGGPNSAFHDELVQRLDRIRDADEDAGLPRREKLRINAVVISHFDLDHYWGIKRVLDSTQFEIGRLYHNGLPRYGDGADKDLDLGEIRTHTDGSKSISADLSEIASAKQLLASGNLRTDSGRDNKFAQFLRSAVKAFDAGRLGEMEMLYRRDTFAAPAVIPDTGPKSSFEILAPLVPTVTNQVRLPVFPDPHDVTPSNPNPAPSESHTINGNSVVLRLRYENSTLLFGGDLNQPAQEYLCNRYPMTHPFQADVNKACHHGSSDFELMYLEAVEPYATVFSSGDTGMYDHPLPDAMGTAAKHSRGEFPLVFSTELARETSKSGEIKLGHINARSNGTDIVMAQKKEKPSSKPWHSFPIPYQGPFSEHH